jgi:hypothetical protein
MRLCMVDGSRVCVVVVAVAVAVAVALLLCCLCCCCGRETGDLIQLSWAQV